MEKQTGKGSGTGRLLEVRFNNLQLLYIDEALGRVESPGLMRESWYRLGMDHVRERAAGKSVILTFPTRLGNFPGEGAVPDCRGEWLPVMIRALQQSSVSPLLAEVLIAVYEAIAWGYGEELMELDGFFDLATIAGKKRLLARREAMERMHRLAGSRPMHGKIAEEVHYGD
ncbi:MAG: hypothetical protein K6F95_07605 [Selenomonas sp.]|uniref:hypothetical protein n=1 Tax=Selenomonas sp. TaxID=2053611 RepID=UPI0025D9062D|nr:hypothetical protein [Selenomonas sp.]MCR5757757.1 hypothetical protein [Selenomonas sp.]